MHAFKKVGIMQRGVDGDMVNKRAFNFEIPARFVKRVEPDFNDSPEGLRRGSSEYLQHKLKRKGEEVAYLRAKPMLPSEMGLFDEASPSRKKKRVIQKKHGPFNLLGLMAQS